MTSRSLTKTDTGFAWIILAASFLNMTLIAGTIRTFGILYAELLYYYDEGAGNTAFMGSLLLFFSSVSGLFSGFLSVHYSFKWCAVGGGFFAGFGMAISYFTKNVETLILTYSVVLGSGLGLTMCPTVTIINFYFEKRRAFANGFLTASLGLASLFYPTFYRNLIDEYGIHGCMLILGGINFNICVGGSFFRQPPCFVRTDKSSVAEEKLHSSQTRTNLSTKTKVINMFKTFLMAMKNPSFILYSVAISLALVGYSSNFNILPPHIESLHFTKKDVVIAISVIGGTELIARMFSGYILDLHYFTVQTMFIVTMFVGGLFSIGYSFFRSEVANIIYPISVGIFPGVLHSLTPLLIVSIFGLTKLPVLLPLINIFSNSACLIGHPFLGWLEDWTGNWTASFYAMGSFFITSSLLVLVERQMCKTTHEATEVVLNNEQDLETDENHTVREQMLKNHQNV